MKKIALVGSGLLALLVACTVPAPPPTPSFSRLLVGTRAKSVFVDPQTGAVSGSLPPGDAQHVYRGRLYLGANTHQVGVYNLEGSLLETIDYDPVAAATDLRVIDDRRIAVLDNADDVVRIIDRGGATLATVAIPHANATLQNLSGIVVGNELVVSENGHKAVFAVDLNDYTARILRDLSGESAGAWLSGIAYWNGFYFTGDNAGGLFRFQETGPIERFASLPEPVSELLVGNGVVYATSYSAGAVYRINLQDGSIAVLASGLDRPRPIDGLP